MIKTLAIETSCDDTSISIISFDWNKFHNDQMISVSQIDDHQKHGGVVPELASRLHRQKIIKLLEKIWLDKIKDVDFITVTAKPGLPGSLLVWVNTAYMLGEFLDKPVLDIDHINAHIFSIYLERTIQDIDFPMVTLTASGGHNQIYLLKELSESTDTDLDVVTIKDKKISVQMLGASRDDASWECFDKVARMLGGEYPGWPWISQMAKKGSSNPKVKFKRIFLDKDKYEFSFSWMKSKAYYLLEQLNKEDTELTESLKQDICYEFQEAMVHMLGKKIIQAGKEYQAKSIVLTWGVSSNDRLFEYVKNRSQKKLNHNFKVLRPISKKYSMDNGAMVWVMWIIRYMGDNE